MSERTITIRGERVTSLESFYAEIGEAVKGPGGYFGSNLDALRDCLRGGYGVEPPFTIVWENSEKARVALGYAETIRCLKDRRAKCHPSNIELVGKDLRRAGKSEGPTVFEWITEILTTAPGVKLQLK